MYVADPGPKLNLTNSWFPYGLEIPMSVLEDEDLDRCFKQHVLNAEGIQTLASSVGQKYVSEGFTTWASKFWAGKATWEDLLLGRCSARWCRQFWTNYDGTHKCRDKPETYKEQPQAAYYREKAKTDKDKREKAKIAKEKARSQDKPRIVRMVDNDRYKRFVQESVRDHRSGYYNKISRDRRASHVKTFHVRRPVVYGYGD